MNPYKLLELARSFHHNGEPYNKDGEPICPTCREVVDVRGEAWDNECMCDDCKVEWAEEVTPKLVIQCLEKLITPVDHTIATVEAERLTTLLRDNKLPPNRQFFFQTIEQALLTVLEKAELNGLRHGRLCTVRSDILPILGYKE